MSRMKMRTEMARLSFMILPMRVMTLSSIFCPMILLTMALVVEAKAQVKTPNRPKILRMALLIARAWRP